MILRAKSLPPVIADERDVTRGVRILRRRCDVMRRIHDQTGHPPLRLGDKGFRGIVEIIVSQQVSAAAAGAIFARTAKTIRPLSAQRVLEASELDLRQCGLSGPKIRALRNVSAAVVERRLNFKQLETASDNDVHRHLTAISGLGPWSADIYLMFCLGRADSWASGDLALQLAMQRALALKQKPDAAACLDFAERWRPWRGVAARLLWAYYSLPAGNTPARKQRTTAS